MLEGTVKHIKTGGLYQVVRTPYEGRRLEYCNESYYEYIGRDGVRWIRRKSEMEDGRFQPLHRTLGCKKGGGKMTWKELKQLVDATILLSNASTNIEIEFIDLKPYKGRDVSIIVDNGLEIVTKEDPSK